MLLSRLSFSHFIELLKLATPLQRAFYEVQAVANNWSVRALKRALDLLLCERTGLSTDNAAVLAAHAGTMALSVADAVKNPYVLEFLGLEERPGYWESDLEQAIIDQLQTFLVELGRGFCFEARQKRIPFDNDHHRFRERIRTGFVYLSSMMRALLLFALLAGASSSTATRKPQWIIDLGKK